MKKIKINFYVEIMFEDNRHGNDEVKYFFIIWWKILENLSGRFFSETADFFYIKFERYFFNIEKYDNMSRVI